MDAVVGDGVGYDDENIPVEELPRGFCKLALNISKEFHGIIIGYKGSTIHRLQAETRTKIRVPHLSMSINEIIITGSSRLDVCLARRKINDIVRAAQENPKWKPHKEADAQEDIPVEELPNGEYKMTYRIPKVLHSQIFGEREEILNELEAETGASILVPANDSTNQEITVTASVKSKVCLAWWKIHVRAIKARSKVTTTHSLSIPLTNSTHLASFSNFKEKILADDEIHVNPDIFQDPKKFNIRIVMFALIDDDDTFLAVQLLEQVKELIQKTLKDADLESLQIHLKGLALNDPVNDDPKSARWLDVNVVDTSGLLKELCNSIVQLYAGKGFTSAFTHRNQITARLSPAVMSCGFVKRLDNYSWDEADKTFDCSKILEKYGDFDFGIAAVSEVHLSRRQTTAEDGYYEATAVVRF